MGAMFWIGYATAVATYLAIGVLLGTCVVISNLARFHGGGFQYRRMAKHVGLMAVFWPAAVYDLIEQ